MAGCKRKELKWVKSGKQFENLMGRDQGREKCVWKWEQGILGRGREDWVTGEVSKESGRQSGRRELSDNRGGGAWWREMLHLSVHTILNLSWVPWSLSPWEPPAPLAEAHLRRKRERDTDILVGWEVSSKPTPSVASKRWGNPFSFTKSNKIRYYLSCGLGGLMSSFWSTVGARTVHLPLASVFWSGK